MKFLSNSCNKEAGITQRAPIQAGELWFHLLVSSLLLALFGGWELSKAGPLELTPALVRTFRSQLADPVRKAELGIYDRLVFGRGRVLRVEGRSRKNVLLALDREGEVLVRLWDLSRVRIQQVKAHQVLHFCGVFSTVDQVSPSLVEVSVTCSNFSARGDCTYPAEALELVERHREIQQRNQTIQSGSRKRDVPETAPDPAASATASRGELTAVGDEGGQDEKIAIGQPSQAPGRPALLRPEQAQDRVAPARTRPAGEPTFVRRDGESDVVIYRRREPKGRVAGSPTSRAMPQVGSAQRKTEVGGMVLVPSGYVTLGSNDPADGQGTLQRVFLEAFYIDKIEVTNEDYREFCEATGHPVPAGWEGGSYLRGKEKHPVVQVSWQDARAYAGWVGKRLPTEAEWERAAEGSRNRDYAYGNVYNPARANTESGQITVAGAYSPNEWGLYDLTGNVSEWTGSLYRPYPYQDRDGREDIHSPGLRVVRGGHHSGNELTVRCLVRQGLPPGQGSPWLGFRCARDGP